MVPSLKAVLIDIDGTMLDSNDAHAQAWCEVFRRHGRDVPYAAVRPLIGKGGDKLLDELTGLADDSDEAKQLNEERRQLIRADYLPQLRATRGARNLLIELRRRRLSLVVATSASEKDLHDLLRQAGIDDLIDAAASSSDADATKPDPDIVEAAMHRAQVRADECVMLGDTPHDVTAARSAGVETIALRCGGWWRDDALCQAIAIYDDPQALLDDLDTSAWRWPPQQM